MDISFHESRGLVLRRRKERLAAWVDPLKIGKSEWFKFEMEVFDLVETESKATVHVAGELVKESGTHNDFYGIGTSWDREVTDLAAHYYKKFRDAGGEAKIITTICRTPSIFSTKPDGFYHHSVRSASVPYTWYYDEGLDHTWASGKSRPRGDEESERTEYVIWENGDWTSKRNELLYLLSCWQNEDTAGDNRYMPSPPSIYRYRRPDPNLLMGGRG